MRYFLVDGYIDAEYTKPNINQTKPVLRVRGRWLTWRGSDNSLFKAVAKATGSITIDEFMELHKEDLE